MLTACLPLSTLIRRGKLTRDFKQRGREKINLYFLHLVDRDENDNKALHQRSINVGRESEAKSVNDILPGKAIALSEIRKRSSSSRNKYKHKDHLTKSSLGYAIQERIKCLESCSFTPETQSFHKCLKKIQKGLKRY